MLILMKSLKTTDGWRHDLKMVGLFSALLSAVLVVLNFLALA